MQLYNEIQKGYVNMNNVYIYNVILIIFHYVGYVDIIFVNKSWFVKELLNQLRQKKIIHVEFKTLHSVWIV